MATRERSTNNLLNIGTLNESDQEHFLIWRYPFLSLIGQILEVHPSSLIENTVKDIFELSLSPNWDFCLFIETRNRTLK